MSKTIYDLKDDIYIIAGWSGSPLNYNTDYRNSVERFSIIRSIKTKKNIKAHLQYITTFDINTIKDDEEFKRILFMSQIDQTEKKCILDDYLNTREYIYLYQDRKTYGYNDYFLLYSEYAFKERIKYIIDNKAIKIYKYKILETNYENLERFNYQKEKEKKLQELQEICKSNKLISKAYLRKIILNEKEVRNYILQFLKDNNIEYNKKFELYME